MRAFFIYALVWFISAAIAFGVYAGGFLNETMQAIFGFYFSSLLIAGFVFVLPAWISEHFAPK